MPCESSPRFLVNVFLLFAQLFLIDELKLFVKSDPACKRGDEHVFLDPMDSVGDKGSSKL